MARKYPSVSWESRKARKDFEAECSECHKAFAKGEVIRVRTTQVSWFRGDDEVDWFHPGACEAAARKKPL